MDDAMLIGRAIDQAGDVLEHVHSDVVQRPTPCRDWSVGDLADHLVNAPRMFVAMMRGEEIDWSAPTPHVEQGWAQEFRNAGDDLVHLWHQDVGGTPAGMQCAELAVHTWDLARALGLPTDELDPDVAEAALTYLRENLTEQYRGEAFGPEQPAPAGAGPYERLAAFAGRPV